MSTYFVRNVFRVFCVTVPIQTLKFVPQMFSIAAIRSTLTTGPTRAELKASKRAQSALKLLDIKNYNFATCVYVFFHAIEGN